MPSISTYVLDGGLSVLNTLGNRLDISVTEPTTFAEATSTLTKGNKTSLSIGAPATRSPSGRKVTVAAITDGAVTGSATVAYWAISDVVNSHLLATGALASPQAVTSGNIFTLAAFDIGIPGPA